MSPAPAASWELSSSSNGYRATGHAARPGDSGALVTDNRDRALGIISDISPDGRWITWTPATTALNNWHLTAVTR